MSHSCDDAETYDVYHETRYKARKQHQCNACRRTIGAGEEYTRLFTVEDGGINTIKRCGVCQVTHEFLRVMGETRSWPDEKLNCGLDYEEEWGEMPDCVAELAFALPGEEGDMLIRVKAYADVYVARKREGVMREGGVYGHRLSQWERLEEASRRNHKTLEAERRLEDVFCG